MSRGGRGGGRGGKRGPDMSWQDEDLDDTPHNVERLKPRPQYPEHYIKVPKPLSELEKSSVKALLQLRDRIRSGPLYTVLEPSNLLDSKGRSNARAGFDPFNDQERFTKRYHRKRRVVPDIAERPGYTLKLFPVELWPVLDPKRRQKEYWDTLPEDVKARLSGKQGTKRKRTDKLRYDDHDITTAADTKFGSEDENNEEDEDDDDEDAIISGNRRRKRTATKTRKADPTAKDAKQKKGLDAEDDYPDVDQQDGDDAGGEAGDDEPQDSEFGTDEDEDGAEDDYNAEQYFDDGEGDDFGDAGGDDDGGGGGGGEWYS